VQRAPVLVRWPERRSGVLAGFGVHTPVFCKRAVGPEESRVRLFFDVGSGQRSASETPSLMTSHTPHEHVENNTDPADVRSLNGWLMVCCIPKAARTHICRWGHGHTNYLIHPSLACFCCFNALCTDYPAAECRPSNASSSVTVPSASKLTQTTAPQQNHVLLTRVQDLSAHLVHHQQVPIRVCPYRVRQL
jgi:hypothetical protein